jgi:chromosome partitioning protein
MNRRIELRLMKSPAVVLLLGMKGGTGKSTVAIHLAVAACQAGRRVTLVDTDPQATSMAWARHREASEPQVMAVRAYEAAKHMAAGQESDLIVVDTPPRAEADISRLATRADLIIIPLRCTMPDLLASEVAFRMAQAAKRPFVLVFNAVNPRGLEVAEVREALTDQGYEIAPVMLAQRTAYARALSSGLAVTEFEANGKGTEEIISLWKWVETRI